MNHAKAYITSAGKYLPGKPVDNENIEQYLGMVHGKPSRTKLRMLRQNGIQFRHYALDRQQQSTHSLAGMAAEAVRDCLAQRGVAASEVDFLAAATTQGDLPVPGFASMVHAESGLEACEIATLHGVCGSGMMAIKNAWMQVLLEGKQHALACAGEFASRMFKASRFEQQLTANEHLPLETDFLRWMLSDGAGALLVQPQPTSRGASLAIDWIDIRSYAHLFEPCMYAGYDKKSDTNSWLDYDNFTQADLAGAINLTQDIK
ncbi:MAG: 3-oxoacyl-ACP synthase, partial [Tunicatimonas sp.]